MRTELKWVIKRKRTRVSRTTPGGSVLIGGGTREVVKVEKILQYRIVGSNEADYVWRDVPTENLPFKEGPQRE
jgi:hypothetical protein